MPRPKGSFARSFGLSADDSYAYVKRAALQFVPLDRVFPGAKFDGEDNQDSVLLTFKITGHLLVAYCPRELEWWEFLGKIEQAYEIAQVADLDVLPAMMLRARRERVVAARTKAARD